MSSLKVLIVDDDPEISTLMKLKLSKEAPYFSISTVEGGHECLEYLKDNRPDCILSDYQMPVMDGMQLLKKIKDDGIDVPFIFVTGQGSEEVARQAFKNGAYDYFTKEIGFAHFVRIINSVEQAVKHRAAERSKAKAEATLLEEKSKLEAVLASIGDGISIQDTDCKILYQNQAHRDLVGEHIGDKYYAAYRGDGEACCCPVEESIKDGQVHVVRKEAQLPGGVRHIEITTSPLRDSSGRIVAGIEAVRDISGRVLIEEALRASEARSKAIIEALPDMVLLFNREGVILDLSARHEGDLYVARDRAIGASLRGLMPPDVADKGMAAIERCLDTGETQTIEYSLPMPDGPREYEARLALSGKEEALCIIRDITGNDGRTLRESERRFRDMLDNVQLIAVMLDTEGRVTYCNDYLLQLTDWRRDEVMGHDWFEKFIPEDQREDTKVYFQQILKQGVTPPHHENRILTRGGARRNVYWSNTLLRDAEGSVTGTNSIGEDVTEKKLVEQEKDAIFYMLTHDIKGPLTLIYGYGELLSQQLKGGNAADTVDEIKKASRRIQSLIDDMLTLAGLESGAGLARLGPVSLPEALHTAVKESGFLASESGVTVELDADDSLPLLRADRVLLGRAFGNLVSNAVKYNRRGGKVLVRAWSQPGQDGRVRIMVSDTGLGIPAEDLPHVFEKYYRGRDAGFRRGTGLGLAVVKAAVEAHGGTVSVESREGEGTTFMVVLPLTTSKK